MLDNSKYMVNDKKFDKSCRNHFKLLYKSTLTMKAYLLHVPLDVEIPEVPAA